MNTKEYDRRKKLLISEHEDAMYALAKEFALSDINAKVGDVVTNGRITIKIERGSISSGFSSYPYCTWEGPEYTKKGVPRKDKAIGYIQDGNII